MKIHYNPSSYSKEAAYKRFCEYNRLNPPNVKYAPNQSVTLRDGTVVPAFAIQYDPEKFDLESTEKAIMEAGTSDMVSAWWTNKPQLQLSMKNRSAIIKKRKEEEEQRKKAEAKDDEGRMDDAPLEGDDAKKLAGCICPNGPCVDSEGYCICSHGCAACIDEFML